MKNIIIYAVLLTVFTNLSFSQDLRLKNTGNSLPSDFTKLNKGNKTTTNVPDVLGTAAFITSLLVNPDIIYENKKMNFGLTKEFSVLLPYLVNKNLKALCRPGIEYTYVFRDERNHHLRGFLNFDIPIEAADYVVLTLGVGGGYFSDFKKSGAFPQTSVNLVIPALDKIALVPYLKLRHTFMFDRTQSDITDFSIGMGITFMPFFD